MWLSILLLALDAAVLPASGAMVKTGSTCVVTPLSGTPNAVAMRSIGTVHPSERDLDTNSDGLWDFEDDAFNDPKPGSPGALGHYPRPEPSKERRGSGGSALPPSMTTTSRRRRSPLEEVGLQERQNPAPVDDTPQILDALKQCGQDGTVILREGTYHIRQVIDTLDLRNCSIEIHGTLIWSDDNLSYWRQRSPSVTYAGRQAAWRIGGRDVALRGFGKALFNGNGQTWIDLARGAANLDGRPISLAIWKGTNILVDGITWRMAQFWHTFVAHSQNVTMTNLDMETYSKNGQSSQNTDGTNTWNSKDIRIANWTVKCGDVSCPLRERELLADGVNV